MLRHRDVEEFGGPGWDVRRALQFSNVGIGVGVE